MTRAIRAAKGAGLDIKRVEIDPTTSRITVVVKNDDTSDDAPKVNPFDTAPLPEPGRRRKQKAPCDSKA